jgi:hypothetical protein
MTFHVRILSSLREIIVGCRTELRFVENQQKIVTYYSNILQLDHVFDITHVIVFFLW